MVSPVHASSLLCSLPQRQQVMWQHILLCVGYTVLLPGSCRATQPDGFSLFSSRLPFAKGLLEPAAPQSGHQLSSEPACLHSGLQLAVQLLVGAGQRVEVLLEPRQVCQHLAPAVRLQ